MVSSNNEKIVALKNQIITKINGLIDTHNSNSSAHSTQFQSKADKTNGASQITDSSANTYTNISANLTSNSTQANINSAINTKLSNVGVEDNIVDYYFDDTTEEIVLEYTQGGSSGGQGGSSVVIADNLTTNDATQALSAKQGKVLNDLIGSAISYINQ